MIQKKRAPPPLGYETTAFKKHAVDTEVFPVEQVRPGNRLRVLPSGKELKRPAAWPIAAAAADAAAAPGAPGPRRRRRRGGGRLGPHGGGAPLVRTPAQATC